MTEEEMLSAMPQLYRRAAEMVVSVDRYGDRYACCLAIKHVPLEGGVKDKEVLREYALKAFRKAFRPPGYSTLEYWYGFPSQEMETPRVLALLLMAELAEDALAKLRGSRRALAALTAA